MFIILNNKVLTDYLLKPQEYLPFTYIVALFSSRESADIFISKNTNYDNKLSIFEIEIDYLEENILKNLSLFKVVKTKDSLNIRQESITANSTKGDIIHRDGENIIGFLWASDYAHVVEKMSLIQDDVLGNTD